MAKEACLIFPHQLFREHPALSKSRKVFLVEEALFFGDDRYYFSFHKQKLLLHKASMGFYFDWLQKRGYDADLIEYEKCKDDLLYPYRKIGEAGFEEIHLAEVVDYELEKRLKTASDLLRLSFRFYDTPAFLNTEAWNAAYFKKNKFFQNNYYKAVRNRFDILMDGGKPLGGQWNFDHDNRKKLPKGAEVPGILKLRGNAFISASRRWVAENFAEHPGTTKKFNYPVSFTHAEQWLDDFLEKRFHHFGTYQDAISREGAYLFHSVLSPALNIGLLTPEQVLNRSLEYAGEHKVPLNSLEGFVRQIAGWREYIRAVYERKGVEERNRNYFHFTRSMPEAFYKANTGIMPVDDVIQKVQLSAYAHHIERLMVLGNFMLLCEINPDGVYQWFMELFIDAYDWVMVPNVYGMSQYADGGLMSTKPYISSSNYILKMSDYKKDEWADIWDALFWRFIFTHKSVFESNMRMSFMVKQLERMDYNKLKNHIFMAEKFLDQLT